MAVCAEEFAVIFYLDSLNIREIIYMIDNEIVEFEDSPFANGFLFQIVVVLILFVSILDPSYTHF